ncbi:MAG: phage tail fiber protein [Veillonellaceae bacterium]|nr:phage tail fiber protein [Veillonellaceae bacterium]
MIQETKTSVVYVGDGRQRSFPFPYRYYDAKDVVGYVGRDGKWERITGNYEYHDSEKSYEYPTTGAPLATGIRLKLARETSRAQEYDFADDRIEVALDKITMMIQEMNRDGLVQVGVGSFDGIIPAGRPFAFLQYNADASGFDVVDLPDFAGEKKVLLAIRDRAEAAANKAETAATRAEEQVAVGKAVLNNSLARIGEAVTGGIARVEAQTQHALHDVEQAAKDAEDKTKGAVQATQDAAAQARKEIAAVQADTEKAKKEITKIQTDVRNDLAQKQNEFNARAKEVLDKVGGLEEIVARGEEAVRALAKYDGLEEAVKAAKNAYDASVAKLERSLAAATGKVEEMANMETAAKAAAQAAQVARSSAEAEATKATTAAAGAKQSATTAQESRTGAEQARTDAQKAKTDAQAANKTAQTAKTAAANSAEQARTAETAATGAAGRAKTSEDAAAASADEAKAAADKAKQIAGGDFLTRAEAETKFAGKDETETTLASKADAYSVYTKTAADERFLKKTDKVDAYTKTEADGRFATNTALNTKANTKDVYSKTDADDRFATAIDMNTKANKTDVYTKSESNAKYQPKGTYASVEYVDGRVANLVNSAPETLDTLQELAAALGNDPNFATTVSNQIGTKADKATTENALAGKANATSVYTKSEVLSKLGDKVDKSTVYTKAQADDRFVNHEMFNNALGTKAGFQELNVVYDEVKDNKQRITTLESDSASYLKKTDASSTYLTKTGASGTYLTKTDASNTYLKKTSVFNSSNELLFPNGAKIGVI